MKNILYEFNLLNFKNKNDLIEQSDEKYKTSRQTWLDLFFFLTNYQ